MCCHCIRFLQIIRVIFSTVNADVRKQSGIWRCCRGTKIFADVITSCKGTAAVRFQCYFVIIACICSSGCWCSGFSVHIDLHLCTGKYYQNIMPFIPESGINRTAALNPGTFCIARIYKNAAALQLNTILLIHLAKHLICTASCDLI